VVENFDFTADSISHTHKPGRRARSILEESVSGREFQVTEVISRLELTRTQ